MLVDEYQDTDPAQEELLHALAGDGRELIAVGDPDQSIYAFRGADVDAIRRFPDRFRAPDGTPARVVALRTVPAQRPCPAGRFPAGRGQAAGAARAARPCGETRPSRPHSRCQAPSPAGCGS